jgi:hypothetical protein
MLTEAWCTPAKPKRPPAFRVPAVKRLYVEVTINSIKPDAARLALQSAAQYGAMAASLKSAGITYDGIGEQFAASPSPVPDAGTPAPPATEEDGSKDEGSSNGGVNVGAIVGGVVGGVAALALAAVTIFFVSPGTELPPSLLLPPGTGTTATATGEKAAGSAAVYAWKMSALPA